jgi:hypothetical protein
MSDELGHHLPRILVPSIRSYQAVNALCAIQIFPIEFSSHCSVSFHEHDSAGIGAVLA